MNLSLPQDRYCGVGLDLSPRRECFDYNRLINMAALEGAQSPGEMWFTCLKSRLRRDNLLTGGELVYLIIIFLISSHDQRSPIVIDSYLFLSSSCLRRERRRGHPSGCLKGMISKLLLST